MESGVEKPALGREFPAAEREGLRRPVPILAGAGAIVPGDRGLRLDYRLAERADRHVPCQFLRDGAVPV